MTDNKQHLSIISTSIAIDCATDEAQDEVDNGAESDSELRQVAAPLQSHGERLDRTLADVVPEFSRNYLQQLIVAGAVQVNQVIQRKSSARVMPAPILSGTLGKALRQARSLASDSPVTVLHLSAPPATSPR